MSKTTSDNGIKAIKAREGEVLHGYLDSVKKLTVGVGHLVLPGEPYKLNQPITAAESTKLLRQDLKSAEGAVNNGVTVPISQNQFDALVSLTFNIGNGAFAKSSLLKKLNAKDYQGCADGFLAWNKAGGKVAKGLVTRRNAERLQFMTPDK